MFQVEATVKMK